METGISSPETHSELAKAFRAVIKKVVPDRGQPRTMQY
jgi:hypothetical protein